MSGKNSWYLGELSQNPGTGNKLKLRELQRADVLGPKQWAQEIRIKLKTLSDKSKVPLENQSSILHQFPSEIVSLFNFCHELSVRVRLWACYLHGIEQRRQWEESFPYSSFPPSHQEHNECSIKIF